MNSITKNGTAWVHGYVTKKERLKFKFLSKHKNVSISEYIRDLVRRELDQAGLLEEEEKYPSLVNNSSVDNLVSTE